MAGTPQPKPAVYSVKETPQGFAVQLNGAVIKTPAGAPLVVPALALADAIAEELRARGKDASINQLAATAIDIVARNRKQTIDQILAYADSELLCHRAENISELSEQQQALWQPLLDWCARRFDAALKSAPGIMRISHAPDSIKALRNVVEQFDNFRLTVLQHAVYTTGSLVLGLAMADKHKDAEEAFRAAQLEEAYQIEKWGEDPETAARRASIKRDLQVCERCFAALTV